MKKVVAVVLVVALVLLAVGTGAVVIWSAITDSRSSGPDRSSDVAPVDPAVAAEARQAPTPDLQSFYDQEVDWTGCEGDHECATLTVPVDYAAPRRRHDRPRPAEGAGDRRPAGLARGLNPGGPGAPGTDYASAAGQVLREPLLRAFDVVGFDPRGTGDSSPVDCLDDDALDAYLAGDPDPDDAAEEQQYAADVRAFGAGCAAAGDVAAHVSTVEAARDMDVLRAALEEPTLTYLGASYGTKLGATYAELFPERVGRLVLDGAMDVSLDNRQLGLEQAEGFETALRAYVQNCVDTTESCFLGDSVDEGLATIDGLPGRHRGVAAAHQRRPRPGHRQRVLRHRRAALQPRLLVHPQCRAGQRPRRAGAGADGAGRPLLLARAGGLHRQQHRGQRRHQLPRRPVLGAVRHGADAYPAYEAASPTFGRIFAWSLTTCRGFTLRSSEAPLDIRGEGAAPILVTGTTRDPATPLKWAEALAAQLDSGVLLRRDGDGHTAYNSGNECVDDTIEAYLLDGTVPQDRLQC